jgi:hypothetical protein
MKQKKLHWLFTFTLFILAVNINAQTSAGKLSLKKGQKFQIDNSIKTNTSMELMGQQMEITSDMTMLRQLEVKEKMQKSYKIASILTKMTTAGSAMGQQFTYDSDKKEDNESEIGKELKGQVNVLKEAEINDQGKAINVKVDTSSASLTDGNPMAAMMKSLGGSQDDGTGTSEAFQVLPAGKKPGDTWTDSTIADGIKTYRTYNVKEVKGNDATVTLTGTQQTDKKMENQGVEVTVMLTSKLSGEAVVDLATGIIKQKTMTVEGSGSADAMGQAIPMTTKVTTVTTVTKL